MGAVRKAQGTDIIIRFGPFEVNRDSPSVRKHGVRLRIQDQPLQVLIALLESAGEIVTREELIKRVWPSGTFVDFEHGLNAAVNRLRQVLGDSAEDPRYIETVARRGYCFIATILQPDAPAPGASLPPASNVVDTSASVASAGSGDKPSLAVLPFTNLTAESDSDYFSDGLAEDIINALTKVPGIRVIARASASMFRNRSIPLREIAERLNVNLILDGSFRRFGNRIRVTAQLVHGAGETCLWSERYDRQLLHVLDVQEDIARSIVNTLRLEVNTGQLIRRYTAKEDAYLFYLKGQFYPHDWNPEAIDHIRNYMKRVVAIEPDYAPAWVELAHAAVGRTMMGVPPVQAMPEGVHAAGRAVSADPQLAEAHGVLAYLKGLYEYDWSTALSEFQIAVELNGASPSIHFWHAIVLSAMGSVTKAISEFRTSLEGDPFSVLTNLHLCRNYTAVGDYDTAIACGERAVQVGPRCFPAIARLGEAYFLAGDVDQGIKLMEQGRSMARVEGWYTAALAYALRNSGQQAQAEKILLDIERKRRDQYVPSAVVAFTASALGDRDRAFRYFHQAVEDRDAILCFVATERSLGPVRDDARYNRLLRSMNIPVN
jgi:TolB-like protein/Tfp pilus assembly protein PilF